MKLALLPVAFAALTSAAPEPPEIFRPITGETGRDGYVFQQKEFKRLSLHIWVVEYRSRAELAAGFRRLFPNAQPSPRLAGFATWNEFGCRIHIVDPAVSYEPHIIGHELAHCLHGGFHPGQESAR